MGLIATDGMDRRQMDGGDMMTLDRRFMDGRDTLRCGLTATSIDRWQMTSIATDGVDRDRWDGPTLDKLD